MRIREGDHLRADLEGRRQLLAAWSSGSTAAALEGRSGVEARLRERVSELACRHPVDDMLVAQEIVRAAAGRTSPRR
jgi:hypothetical protein